MKNTYFSIVIGFLLSTLPTCNGCFESEQPNYTILCVDPGSHLYKPAQLFSVDSFRYVAYNWDFTESEYLSNDPQNQYDWLKLTGLSADLFTNRANSMLVGFRFLPGRGWQATPYYHDNGERFFPSNEIPILDFDGQLETHINVFRDNPKKVAVTLIAESGSVYFEHEFSIPFYKTRIVSTWHGGDETATETNCIKRSIISNE